MGVLETQIQGKINLHGEGGMPGPDGSREKPQLSSPLICHLWSDGSSSLSQGVLLQAGGTEAMGVKLIAPLVVRFN